jgi:nitrate reductase beta subunit
MFDERGACGFSFGNGCSGGDSDTNLFGAPARKKLQTPTEIF